MCNTVQYCLDKLLTLDTCAHLIASLLKLMTFDRIAPEARCAVLNFCIRIAPRSFCLHELSLLQKEVCAVKLQYRAVIGSVLF
jgi:hypothetical protein